METIYKTSDLPIATAMMTMGYIFTGIEGKGKRKYFVLDYINAQYEPQAIEIMFKSNNLQVDARTFSDNLKLLKSELYKHDSK